MSRNRTLIEHHKKADHQAAFLAAYAIEGTISHACKVAGIGRTTHYDWMRDDPDYAARFKDADEQATEALEREARRRAIEGTVKPVFHNGREVGAIREYSDTLLIFLLKGARPNKYRERVDVSLDIRAMVATFAQENGLDEGQVIAEAERLLADGRR